jgi:RecA/RadA recombinase
MNIEFTGSHYSIDRVVLPFHSINHALKGIDADEFGFPTRTVVEIYGPTGIGKSTLCTALASYVSQALDNLEIAYLDLEGQDKKIIQRVLESTGYEGKFNWVSPPKSKGKVDLSDEAMLNALLEEFYNDPPCVGILDSVAAIASRAEVQGEIGDANMGRRAFGMAQFSRGVSRALRSIEVPTALFMINHWYEKMGTIGPAKQYTAPGGVVKENLEKLRIQVKVPWVDYLSGGDGKTEGRFEGGWIIEGKVEKNRSGAKNKVFQVFVYGGQGVHVGMSALVDCLAAGLAEVKTGGKVVMDGQDFGTLKKIVANKKDDKEFFIAFHNALKVETIEDDTVSEDKDEE